MTAGERIYTLRKEHGLSQGDLADKLDVSRQTISKWENNLCLPEIEKLILLSKAFSVSADYIIKGTTTEASFQKTTEEEKMSVKPKKHIKKSRIITAVVLSLLLIISFGFAVFIFTRPVSFDAGACGGGYKAYIFNKYSQELLNEHTPFLLKDDVISFKIANENYEVDWLDSRIFIYFDIEYESLSEGTVTQRVSYTGNRIWTDTFRWKTAHLVDE